MLFALILVWHIYMELHCVYSAHSSSPLALAVNMDKLFILDLYLAKSAHTLRWLRAITIQVD